MLTAKVIRDLDGQSVRLPSELETTESEFVIRKRGNCYFLYPIDDPWALLRESIGQVDEDISFDRDQPMINELPERKAL